MKAKWLLVAVVCLGAGALLVGRGWPQAHGVTEYRGTLRRDLIPIGCQSTGVTLDTGSVWYQLDVPPEVASQHAIRELDGRRVVVIGVLHVGRGVEGYELRIIRVKELRLDESG